MANQLSPNVHELPPGTKCDIVGADIVWAHGGRVFVVDVAINPATGRKYSTTDVIAKVEGKHGKEEKETNQT